MAIPPPFGHHDILPQRVSTPARPTNLPNPLPTIIFFGLTGAGALGLLAFGVESVLGIATTVGGAVAGGLAASAVRIAAQWEKALVFRLGKLAGERGPGIFGIVPFFDAVRLVDTRITTLDVPRRQAITKDNVPVSLDGVIFMRVIHPALAVTRVRNYEHAIQQYAQTALRDIVGSMTLDEILADRELVGKKIEEMVEVEIDGWGIDLAAIRIQDIELPEDLKRVMARQASAEREKRATITKAEGDAEAAANLAQAAKTMAESPGALQLRSLQTLDGLGSSPSNTVVLAVPVEVMNALHSVPQITEIMRRAKAAEEPK
jgi:regulator of protease activity HflC (stomatin/prohibitin superfamily)